MDERELNVHWYVLQTHAGYEKSVQASLLTMVENTSLQDYIFDVVVPEEEEIVEKNGKQKVVLRKKFPCYVFIKMIYSKNVWYNVTQTRGVTSFCGPGGRPLPLTEDEVRRNKLEAITAEEAGITVGDQVTILEGSLKDFIGEVTEIDFETQKIKVVVKMFGKDTPCTLDLVQVEKIGA